MITGKNGVIKQTIMKMLLINKAPGGEIKILKLLEMKRNFFSYW